MARTDEAMPSIVEEVRAAAAPAPAREAPADPFAGPWQVRRSIFGLAVLASLALAIPVLVLAQSEAPACVAIRHEARYGADGYNHVVIVRNGCQRRVHCRIATDVNPRQAPITVGAGETVETVTFLGSPAREFTPRVSCEEDR